MIELLIVNIAVALAATIGFIGGYTAKRRKVEHELTLVWPRHRETRCRARCVGSRIQPPFMIEDEE